MDDIEKKVTAALRAVPFGNSNVVDEDIIKVFELNSRDAALEIGWGESQEDSAVVEEIKKALVGTGEIDTVSVRFSDRMNLPSQETEKKQAPSGAHGPGPAPGRETHLRQYRHIIAVASGKGGVGKSTVALNLAYALKHLGRSVSVFDADIYGPSLPIMLGEREAQAKTINNRIMPLSKYGVEFMSIGSLVAESASVVWRGPMVHQAVEQILRDTEWPGGDYIILDLPPGTGDVQITLSQVTALTGAVIVCTPQDVALIDAARAISMFGKVNIPILGMVENMSSFICPKCSAETPIFGVGGCERESSIHGYNFLGRLPIDLETRLCGDSGLPIMVKSPDSTMGKAFITIAERLEESLS